MHCNFCNDKSEAEIDYILNYEKEYEMPYPFRYLGDTITSCINTYNAAHKKRFGENLKLRPKVKKKYTKIQIQYSKYLEQTRLKEEAKKQRIEDEKREREFVAGKTEKLNRICSSNNKNWKKNALPF